MIDLELMQKRASELGMLSQEDIGDRFKARGISHEDVIKFGIWIYDNLELIKDDLSHLNENEIKMTHMVTAFSCGLELGVALINDLAISENDE